MKFLIVSGLSGSGKSVALHLLEDLGCYCMDNMPLGLLEDFARQAGETDDPRYDLVAVGVDARARPEDIARFEDCIRRLRDAGVTTETLFLQADESIILKRYSETRRKHPLTRYDIPLAEAITRERELLSPIAACADLIIDTSRTNIHQLREMIASRVHQRQGMTSLLLQSFGYKHGLPADADYVFDIRCLPNPYWEAELRGLTGRDAAVRDYLEGHPLVERMYSDIRNFLVYWLPHFEAGNRSYLTVAIGCTGGQHRSVYMIERIGNDLRRLQGRKILIRHGELS